MSNSIEQNSPFVKQLASSDRRTRDKGVESLRSYLRHRGPQLNSLDLLKLWKGLFYCMWMSDRPRTQQQLARDLATLVDVLPMEAALPFLDAFWKTMAREWIGIDVLRMDKFLYLVRVYLNASFRLFAKKGWQTAGQLDEYMSILSETPLNARDTKIPNGMRYHVIDIYVDELDRLEQSEQDKMPIERLLQPLRVLGKESLTKTVRERIREALEDERIREWLGEADTEEQPNGEKQGFSESVDKDAGWNGIED